MKKFALIVFAILILCAMEIRAQTTVSDVDKAAIKQPALRYSLSF